MEKVKINADVKIDGIDFPAGQYPAVYSGDTVKIFKDENVFGVLEVGGGVDTSFYNDFVEKMEN